MEMLRRGSSYRDCQRHDGTRIQRQLPAERPSLYVYIKGTDDGLSEEIEGYYDLSGVRLSGSVRGITIVKYKDGHCVKLYK